MKRYTKNSIFFGVCSGLAKEFGCDLSVIRVALTAITLLTGIYPGIIAYVIAAIFMSDENDHKFIEDILYVIKYDKKHSKKKSNNVNSNEYIEPEVVKNYNKYNKFD